MNIIANLSARSRRLACLLCLCCAGGVFADDVSVPKPFTDVSLDDWQQRSFQGNSQYRLVTDQGVRVLQAKADGQASLLYKQQKVSLRDTPILSWYWKINDVFSNIDEQSRDGDDFSARVYVAYQYGRLPWQVYVINYVWASHTPKGQTWTNPYSNKSRMIAVQSGGDLAGKWQHEERDVAADFKTLFNVEVTKLGAIAIMVDADNTGQSATAHFGAIGFSGR